MQKNKKIWSVKFIGEGLEFILHASGNNVFEAIEDGVDVMNEFLDLKSQEPVSVGDVRMINCEFLYDTEAVPVLPIENRIPRNKTNENGIDHDRLIIDNSENNESIKIDENGPSTEVQLIAFRALKKRFKENGMRLMTENRFKRLYYLEAVSVIRDGNIELRKKLGIPYQSFFK
jgi:hypothetical protein